MGFSQHGRGFAGAKTRTAAARPGAGGAAGEKARQAAGPEGLGRAAPTQLPAAGARPGGSRPPQWHLGVWLVLGALVVSACQPRPRFKVDVANIDDKTTSLQVSLWLGNTSSASGILSNSYTELAALNPPSGFEQFTVPDCGTGDKSCVQNKRDYTFGVNYATDPSQARHTALVGVAAVDAAGCLHNVLTGEITDPAELGDPQTLPLSLLHGTVDTATCVKGDFIITDVAAEFDVRVSGASPIHLLIVNGWGFRPDATLLVSDGCTLTPIPQARSATGQALPASDAVVVSVTPTQIVAQLGNINVLRVDCGGVAFSMPKTVAVVAGPAGSTVTSPTFSVR